MRKSILGIWASLALVIHGNALADAGANSGNSGAAPAVKTVKLLCADKANGLLRSCDEALQIEQNAIRPLIENTKQYCYYHEIDVDLFKGSAQFGSAGTPGTPPAAGTPGICSYNQPSPPRSFDKICNLMAGETAKPDPKWGVSYDCGQPLVSSGGKLYAQGTVGTAETRYMMGAFVQTLIACENRVLSEMQTKHGFDVQAFSTVAAGDAAAKARVFTDLNNNLVSTKSIPDNVSIDQFCSGSNDGSDAADTEKAKHKQAVCYVAAARTTQEAMITYIAAGEIMGRQTLLWPSVLGALQGAQHDLMATCQTQAAQNAPQHSWGCCGSSLCPGFACFKSQQPDEIQTLFNQCYRNGLSSAIKTKMQQVIPTDGSTCTYAGSTLGWIWGLRRRRKRRAGRRLGRRTFFRLARRSFARARGLFAQARRPMSGSTRGPTRGTTRWTAAAILILLPALGGVMALGWSHIKSARADGRIGQLDLGRGDGWVSCDKINNHGGKTTAGSVGCQSVKNFTDSLQNIGDDSAFVWKKEMGVCSDIDADNAGKKVGKGACYVGMAIVGAISEVGVVIWDTFKAGMLEIANLFTNGLAALWNLLVDAICEIISWVGWTPGFCGGDSNDKPPAGATQGSGCPNSAGVSNSDRSSDCCSNGTPSGTCPANYPIHDPTDLGGSVLPLINGQTGDNLNHASALLGYSPPFAAAPTGTSPHLATGPTRTEATAGGPGGPAGTAKAAAAPTAGGFNPGSNGPGGSGGGFGAGGSGGGGSDFGGLHTSAMPDTAGATAGSGPADAGSGAMYKSGSGGSGTGGGEGGPGFFRPGGGFGTADVANGGKSEQSFNADMNGTTGVASTSEDPEDYFTRIGIGDNLFKIVERRYHEKSRTWVTDDLQKAPLPGKR